MQREKAPSTFAEGQIVGGYKLKQSIPLAGAVVFEAERVEFTQSVAVEWLDGQHDPSSDDLDHRYLVRVLDHGTTANGTRFRVLEQLSGEPLDVYCDRHRLRLSSRLNLVSQIIAATAYAHQQLASHRRLTCGSTLVFEDAVKVHGFCRHPSADRSVGGDIRAVGAMLGHLLSGVPVASESTDPKPMHTALAAVSLQQRATIAEARSTSSTSLQKALSSDLEAMVAKALRSGADTGYGSAEELGEDLRRYAQGLPVSARSAGRVEAALTWSRHHPALVLAGLLLTICLIAGSWMILRATANARRERQITEVRLTNLMRLTASLDSGLYAAASQLQNPAPIQLALLNQLEKTLEASVDSDSDKTVRCEVAVQFRSLAQLDARAGQPDLQRKDLERAEVLAQAGACAPQERGH